MSLGDLPLPTFREEQVGLNARQIDTHRSTLVSHDFTGEARPNRSGSETNVPPETACLRVKAQANLPTSVRFSWRGTRKE